MLHGIDDARRRDRRHRQAGSHGLDDGQGMDLADGGSDEEVGRRQIVAYLLIGDAAREMYGVLDPELCRLLAEICLGGTVADQQKMQGRLDLAGQGELLQQPGDALFRRQPAGVNGHDCLCGDAERGARARRRWMPERFQRDAVGDDPDGPAHAKVAHDVAHAGRWSDDHVTIIGELRPDLAHDRVGCRLGQRNVGPGVQVVAGMVGVTTGHWP